MQIHKSQIPGHLLKYFEPVPLWSYEIAERLALADPVRYVAKASRRERDAGLGGRTPCTNAERTGRQMGNNSRGSLGGSGKPVNDTGFRTLPRNPHPTVKPIKLLIWLSKLLAPPPEYAPRRLLIPFSGSGSEICAAILSECWEEIVAIEISEEYCEIAEARCQFWETMMRETGTSDPRAILKIHGKRDKKQKSSDQMLLDL